AYSLFHFSKPVTSDPQLPSAEILLRGSGDDGLGRGWIGFDPFERSTDALGDVEVEILVRAGALIITQLLNGDTGFGGQRLRLKSKRQATIMIALGLSLRGI